MSRIFKFFKDKEIKNVIDCGCHKGDFVDAILKKNHHSKIYCFEPLKKNFYYLKNKYKLNKNIEIYNNGIGDKNINLNLKVNVEDNASTFSDFNENSLYFKFRKFVLGSEQVVVRKEFSQLITLDHFFLKKNLTNIDLLKLDVEGYELKALKGGIKTLKNTKYLLIEITTSNLFKNYSVKNILFFLKEIGFVKVKSFIFPILNFKDMIFENKNYKK